MSHTPGPWKYSGFTVYALQDFKRGQVNRFWAGFMSAGVDVATQPELEANARLCATAPELLTVAYIVRGMLRRQFVNGEAPDWWGDDEHEALSVCEQAIRHATGEQSEQPK